MRRRRRNRYIVCCVCVYLCRCGQCGTFALCTPNRNGRDARFEEGRGVCPTVCVCSAVSLPIVETRRESASSSPSQIRAHTRAHTQYKCTTCATGSMCVRVCVCALVQMIRVEKGYSFCQANRPHTETHPMLVQCAVQPPTNHPPLFRCVYTICGTLCCCC